MEGIDGSQVKNKANPTGTTKMLTENGTYVNPPGAGGGLSLTQIRRLNLISKK